MSIDPIMAAAMILTDYRILLTASKTTAVPGLWLLVV
jgi:hypothetical protein